jgi:hypothetical protein
LAHRCLGGNGRGVPRSFLCCEPPRG